MAEDRVSLTDGGRCVVLVGYNGLVNEYKTHPQVQFIETKSLPGAELEGLIRDDTRVIITTEGVPQYHYAWATSYAHRRKIPWLVRRSNQAVLDTIRGFFSNGQEAKATVEEVKQSWGKLKAFEEFIDLSKSNAENAKNLLRKAHELHIKTTVNSLAQYVSRFRREKSGTGLPKSARNQLDVSVELLDETIKNLTDMRDFLIATCEENRLLKAKLDKFKKAFED